MPLTYNLKNIKDWQELIGKNHTPEPDSWSTPYTMPLIFLTNIIGIPEITKKNFMEFATRVRIYENCAGGMVYCHGQRNIPLAQIKRHIGLKTNANTLTRSQFLKWVIVPNVQEKLISEKES